MNWGRGRINDKLGQREDDTAGQRVEKRTQQRSASSTSWMPEMGKEDGEMDNGAAVRRMEGAKMDDQEKGEGEELSKRRHEGAKEDVRDDSVEQQANMKYVQFEEEEKTFHREISKERGSARRARMANDFYELSEWRKKRVSGFNEKAFLKEMREKDEARFFQEEDVRVAAFLDADFRARSESNEEKRRDDDERMKERIRMKTGRSRRRILIDMGYLSESGDKLECKKGCRRHRWDKSA